MPRTRPPGPYDDPPRPVSPTIDISADGTSARIATRGAEPVAWSVDGAGLLWDADPTWWPKSAPVLFPLVGQTVAGSIKVDEVRYPMPVHGFAPTSTYAIEEKEADHVRMSLTDDAATRAAYPFAFALTADYRVAPGRFSAVFAVSNTGAVAMPYAIGFHPGFNWPFAGGDKFGHAIVFENAEDPHVPEVASTGMFKASRRYVPMAGQRLQLTEGLLAGTPLCFSDARSRSLRFENGVGGAIVVDVEDFPHFAIWTKAGAPYLSIEEWTSHADPEGFDGELFDKPFMRFLPAGQTARHAVHLRYETGQG